MCKEHSVGRKFELWKEIRSNEITLVGDGVRFKLCI